MNRVASYQLAGQRSVLGCPPGFCRSACTALRSKCSGSGACKSVKIQVVQNYYSKNSKSICQKIKWHQLPYMV